MKKRTMVGLALALALTAGGTAHAGNGGCCGSGTGSDCQAVKNFEAAAGSLTAKGPKEPVTVHPPVS